MRDPTQQTVLLLEALRKLRGDELAAADGATQDYHALLGRWDGPVSCPAGVLRVLRE